MLALPSGLLARSTPAELLAARTRWRPRMEFEVGRLFLRHDDPAKRAEAVRRLEAAARAGNARAAVFLGYAAEAGLTGEPSLDAALTHYRQAARAGDRVGAIALEASLASREDARLVHDFWYSNSRIQSAEYTDYFDWIRKKAADGSPRHQYMLGRLLEAFAIAPTRDEFRYREAERLYRRAAASGHPEAAFQLWNDYKEHCNDGFLEGIVRSIKEIRYERKARRTGSQLFELYHSAPVEFVIPIPPVAPAAVEP